METHYYERRQKCVVTFFFYQFSRSKCREMMERIQKNTVHVLGYRKKIARIEKNHDIEQNPIYQHEN